MKKLLLCVFTGSFLVACGGSSTDENNQSGQTDPLDPAKIHDVVPNVNYNNSSIMIDHINFDGRQNGKYTSDMFNTDFNNEWGSVTGDANILDRNGSKELAVTHPKGHYKKGISGGKDLNEFNEVYFSYEITFGKDYDFSMGGKMPGLAGLNPNVSAKPDGCKTIGEDEGFSLRSMFREDGRAIGYFYHQDKTKTCGDEIDYQHEGKDFSFKREKTYLIEQYVKMNDANQANGIVTIYVNGFKVLERKNMTFSENGIYAINYQYTQLWHGGNSSDWAVDRDSTAYFDNVALSSAPLSYSK
ncbi:hypothetical protein HWV00_09895 [Moritella sp. 24]|uniref:polysaccharide lyase n=1 Tax=Moritella sp. 24 TaxID=2746230 RepID=UPI001BADECAB|nr:hypothetical protein [Moritella sp. 24]QUM76514.1 hypothetical protein HWV00_09895 [Moritella sp. 24]